MDVPPIRSPRLDLVSLPSGVLEALLEGRRLEAERQVSVAFPAGWPARDVKPFLRLRLEQMLSDPEAQRWLVRALVRRRDATMIGYAGFHGPPGTGGLTPGKAELGYTVFPSFRGRGYATEAAVALMDWAESEGIRRYVASVAPGNDPSLAIVCKLGFVQTGEQWDEEDGLELVFELDRSPDPADGQLESGAMATYRYVVADVFTDTPLEGNQLAVFTDAREIPEAELQQLAKEVNFSETVFVYTPEADGHARIRIFTPVSELPFAGHPVLGTAFVLAGPLQLPEIRLETGMGVVPVTLERDENGRIVFGRMSQPIPTVRPFERGDELLAALGVEGSELPLELYESGVGNVYVLLPDEEAVSAVEPDLAAVARVMGDVHANCTAGSGARWRTRMFAPGDGVPEDPATGSAAGPLAVHLARHARVGFGEEIVITQGVEIGRPSTLYAKVEGSPERVERVEVGGSAVVVARGEFVL